MTFYDIIDQSSVFFFASELPQMYPGLRTKKKGMENGLSNRVFTQ